MYYEKSCGAVVFYSVAEQRKYLLLKHKNGDHWGFPKGHVEPGETEIETALREIHEEAGLRVSLREGFRHKVEYSPKENVWKEVVYFIGEASEPTVVRQEEEIKEFCWVDYETGMGLLSFENSKQLLKRAHQFLQQ